MREMMRCSNRFELSCRCFASDPHLHASRDLPLAGVLFRPFFWRLGGLIALWYMLMSQKCTVAAAFGQSSGLVSDLPQRASAGTAAPIHNPYLLYSNSAAEFPIATLGNTPLSSHLHPSLPSWPQLAYVEKHPGRARMWLFRSFSSSILYTETSRLRTWDGARRHKFGPYSSKWVQQREAMLP
ncbi:hypothetical protein PMIN04_002041 [Paraphaeosphaeria minitans]